jgi:hypothetical protein
MKVLAERRYRFDFLAVNIDLFHLPRHSHRQRARIGKGGDLGTNVTGRWGGVRV